MTSVASSKGPASTPSASTNGTKASPLPSTKKEVNNNTPSRANGAPPKPSPVVNKKSPIVSTPIKRKTRVLSDSDDSDTDNQSLVSKINNKQHTRA